MCTVTDPTDPKLDARHDSYDTRSERRKAHREFLAEALIEAEKETGRHEKTDDEARHAVWLRLVRLIGGWILVLVGIAGLVLPGPGWLIVILGLSLLPYVWAENLIRTIRRRIPGIPEDGRIPTSTWVLMGVMVALSLVASIWWGLRGGNEEESGATAPTTAIADAPTPEADPIVAGSPSDPTRAQLASLYGSIAAEITNGTTRHVETLDQCAAITGGDIDLALLTETEMPECFGPETEQQDRLRAANTRAYAPVVSGTTTYHVVVRAEAIAIDDEPAENALDAVSEQISAGADISGSPKVRARALLADVGMLN